MCVFFFSQSDSIPAHTDGQDGWPAGENVRAHTWKCENTQAENMLRGSPTTTETVEGKYARLWPLAYKAK